MRTFDFSSLAQPVTTDDMKKVAPSTGALAHKVVAWIGATVIIMSFLVAVIVTLSVSDASRANVAWTTLLVFGSIGTVLSIVGAVNRRRTRYLAIVNRFAGSNELIFRFDTSPHGLKGMIFDVGHSRKVTDVLAFPDGIEVGNYQYITGSGKNSQMHKFGYVRIALNKSLPNMVLDAKGNNFIGMTNLPDVYHSSQRLQLEGNFNTYFDLYVPKRYERDALYVFTPDVMQVLIDTGRKYDMEVIDNELYVYQPAFINLSSEPQLKEVLGAVDLIASELRNQTKRYKDERAQIAEGQMIAENGRRLKHGINWLVVLIVAGVVSINLVVSLAPHEFRWLAGSFVGILFWAVVIFAFVRRLRR